jgi:hypothetical protein
MEELSWAWIRLVKKRTPKDSSRKNFVKVRFFMGRKDTKKKDFEKQALIHRYKFLKL